MMHSRCGMKMHRMAARRMACPHTHDLVGCCGGSLSVLGMRNVHDMLTWADWMKARCSVGEASNPGPSGQQQQQHGGHVPGKGTLSDRAPGKSGFWQAQAPGYVVDGSANDLHASGKLFELQVITTNTTSWRGLRDVLRSTSAHVVLAQEHHPPPEDIPAKAAWAARRGWKAIFFPAAPGNGTGWRAGVAILTRNYIGLSPPRTGSGCIVPARALAAVIGAPGYRPFTAVSAYLEDGGNMGKTNMAIMANIGAFLNAQGEHDQFLIGADFQCDPEVLAATGFADRLGANVVAARAARGTHRTTRVTSEIDYVVISLRPARSS